MSAAAGLLKYSCPRAHGGAECFPPPRTSCNRNACLSDDRIILCQALHAELMEETDACRFASSFFVAARGLPTYRSCDISWDISGYARQRAEQGHGRARGGHGLGRRSRHGRKGELGLGDPSPVLLLGAIGGGSIKKLTWYNSVPYLTFPVFWQWLYVGRFLCCFFNVPSFLIPRFDPFRLPLSRRTGGTTSTALANPGTSTE